MTYLNPAHLDPRYFEKPKEFIPERWIEHEKYPLTYNQKVFIPFWTGNFPHSEPGKLA